MSETSKERTRKLSEAVEILPEAERKYILGLAEGIAIANKNKKQDKQEQDKPKKTG